MSFKKAMTDGVVGLPPWLGTITGVPFSITWDEDENKRLLLCLGGLEGLGMQKIKVLGVDDSPPRRSWSCPGRYQPRLLFQHCLRAQINLVRYCELEFGLCGCLDTCWRRGCYKDWLAKKRGGGLAGDTVKASRVSHAL